MRMQGNTPLNLAFLTVVEEIPGGAEIEEMQRFLHLLEFLQPQLGMSGWVGYFPTSAYASRM